MPADFVHLHVHSHFSLLQSTITVPKLIAAVQAGGMDAVALTDRGNLFGAFELHQACKDGKEKAKEKIAKAQATLESAAKAAAERSADVALADAAAKAKQALEKAAADHGVHPIFGCQLNVAPLGMAGKDRGSLQLVVLAAGPKGWGNLTKLVSLGYLEGMYFDPRVDFDCIARHAEDLICLTGAGPDGFLGNHLVKGTIDEADRQAGLLREAFGDRLYVEVADDALFGSLQLRAATVALARRCGLPLVATNYVHYLAQADAKTHDVQLAVDKATTLNDPRRRRMPSQEFYLKTPAEMAALFADLPEAIANTRVIAERCRAEIPTKGYHLPRFPCPPGETEDTLLRRKCAEGYLRRYRGNPPAGAPERLEFELTTIIKMGFPAYFLIVADFITWAKDQGIPVGPGRGSAAGSLVAYCMGITDMCPLAYGLLFERFMNPGRASMPDIDIDFCKDRRDEVVQYVKRLYGEAAVCNIMTLGTMKARMAIKDAARAFEWSPEESQELANLVPEDPSGKHDLQVCLGRKPLDAEKREFGTVDAMVKRYDSDPRAHDVLDAALALEKLGRSLGIHACGIIIAPKPVHELVPVCTVKNKPATQFNMTQVEKCGLLKMDFLGLKTMTMLKTTLDIVAAAGGPRIALGDIPLDDPATFALLGTGRTLGVFQCESRGFQDLIRRLQPDRFADMIALVALYRPGPLMANMHIDYCDRKHGARVEYPHPALEAVLSETYGLYIYQEQVMSISRELCGFTPAQADDLRKAMGKKDKATLEKLKNQFVEGAWDKHRFDREKSAKMWENILGFASYCFNKSHSACYGLIAYWTAWCKANHYAAFMTANLIHEMDNKDKMTQFVEELRDQGIAVLPPDVNESGWEFTLVKRDGKPAIRFGFGGVKAVGEGAAKVLIEERRKRGPFTTLFDLCERVDTRTINKRVVDALIKVGALDALHGNRHALHLAMEPAFERGTRLGRSREVNQQTLFEAFEADDSFKASQQAYPNVEDWPVQERLAHEKAATGYWISSHPVRESGAELLAMASHNGSTLSEAKNNHRIAIVAVVVGKRVVRTKTGKSLGILQLEDGKGRFEAVLFPGGAGRSGRIEEGAYERFAGLCEPDTVALFVGEVQRRERRSAPRPQANADEDITPGDDDGEDGAMPVAVAAEPEQEPPSLKITKVVPAGMLLAMLTREVRIAIDVEQAKGTQIRDTETALKEHAGDRPVLTTVHLPGDVALEIPFGERWLINPTPAAIARLRAIWGEPQVRLVLDPPERLLAS